MNETDPQPGSTEDLAPLVYQELRGIARQYFRRQNPGFTLRPTELVNEACLHLLRHAPGPWDSPEHFRAIAVQKIWQIVIDHVKRRNARKRGGGGRRVEPYALAPDDSAPPQRPGADRWRRVPLESIRIEWRDREIDLLDLAEALDDLAKVHERHNQVVMLHWFGGLKYDDAARLLGVSSSTVEKDFRYALAWLNRRLESRDGDA